MPRSAVEIASRRSARSCAVPRPIWWTRLAVSPSFGSIIALLAYTHQLPRLQWPQSSLIGETVLGPWGSFLFLHLRPWPVLASCFWSRCAGTGWGRKKPLQERAPHLSVSVGGLDSNQSVMPPA